MRACGVCVCGSADVCASVEHMYEYVCARARRDWGVTPAVGLNRVSGRALQQAAAACSHCERDPGVAATGGPDVCPPVPPTTIHYHCSHLSSSVLKEA